MPDTIAAEGEAIVVQLHAEGAQIYECKSDEGNKLTWQFREPIATLFLNGVTVGRHYAGPTWEVGGGAVVGKVVGNAPGTGPKDIPWLKLDVSDRRGGGPLKDVTTIQRINTAGGNTKGSAGRPAPFVRSPTPPTMCFCGSPRSSELPRHPSSGPSGEGGQFGFSCHCEFRTGLSADPPRLKLKVVLPRIRGYCRHSRASGNPAFADHVRSSGFPLARD